MLTCDDNSTNDGSGDYHSEWNDESKDNDPEEDDSLSGRDELRIPGGSGRDCSEVVAEHPECRGTTGGAPSSDDSASGRDEPRDPGGSGCDTPEDIVKLPECLLPAEPEMTPAERLARVSVFK